jgi:lysophospholipase L1-like esterase
MGKRKYIIAACIGLLFSGIRVFSQDYPHEIPRFDFIRYSQNRISFPEDAQPLNSFYTLLNRLIFQGIGQTNIVHIGGSHVQADIVSGRLRDRLSSFFPGNKGSRGLVFPFRIANTNNPHNYVVQHTGSWNTVKCTHRLIDRDLGLTGMAVYSRDPSSTITISLQQSHYTAYDFNRIKVFHLPGDTQFDIYPTGLSNGSWRMYRDSIKGITTLYLDEYSDKITLSFTQRNPNQNEIYLMGLSFENDDPGLTYHSIGVNGAGTYSFLKCLYWEEHLRELKPNLILFGVGINDAATSGFSTEEFKNNYRRLIQKVRSVHPDIGVLLITNNDSYVRMRKGRYANNSNGELVRIAMFELAKELNLAVWDFYTIMGGQGSMQLWEMAGLAQKDKVHFTSAGYKLMGDLLFSALLSSYEQFLIQLPQP